MSRDFFKIIAEFTKIISIKRNIQSPNETFANFVYFSMATGAHAIYSYGTEKKEEIKVNKKYKMVNYGSTQFMVVDNKGRHFNLNNSFWFWKWDSIEDWERIKKGDDLHIKYYGLRMPFIGTFPNIFESKKK